MSTRVKYSRTYHLPWSLGVQSDDNVIASLDAFVGQRVVVTEKMDGENTSIYNDYIHARSIDGRSHPSRDWVKRFQSTIARDIPDGWRVCGENLFAKHSVGYTQLPSYFLGFSIWTDDNVCLSWDETVEWFDVLDVVGVPILYDDIYDESAIKELGNKLDLDAAEGYVIRVADSFHYDEFKHKVAKFVRVNHVQTDEHWMHAQIIPNELIK